MARLHSTSQVETASRDSTTLRMRRLKNLLVLPSTLQVKLPLLETSIDSMSITSTKSVLNGMKSAAR